MSGRPSPRSIKNRRIWLANSWDGFGSLPGCGRSTAIRVYPIPPDPEDEDCAFSSAITEFGASTGTLAVIAAVLGEKVNSEMATRSPRNVFLGNMKQAFRRRRGWSSWALVVVAALALVSLTSASRLGA